MHRLAASRSALGRVARISSHVGQGGAGGSWCTAAGKALRSNATSAAPPSDLGTTQFINVNGRRLFVLSAGSESSDATPVLCMPGAMGTAETDFFKQLEGLSKKHRVVSYDPRGYGRSRPPNREWSMEFYHQDARDAHAIMASLGINAYNVIGWSDGANAGVILAAEQPEAVKKLVIFGGNAWVEQADIDSYEATRDIETQWSKGMKKMHVPVYGDELQPMWSAFCDHFQERLRQGGNICKDEAVRIKCPTFVMAGKKDAVVPLFHPEWFSKNIPGAKFHVFPEGKHNIHIKYGEEFNQMVLDFFAE